MSGNTGTILAVVGAVAGGLIGGPPGVAIGMAVGQAVGTAIDPPITPGPELGDSSAQTSRAGVPIADMWGTNAVVGNIIQMNPIEKETNEVGSKKARTTETRAFRTFAIGFGRSYRGPMGGVLRIWENKKLVVDLRETPDIPTEETEAYLEGITIYLGGETQMPDGDLESHTGVGFTPAYRGLAYIVWKRKDITDFGQAIPEYMVEWYTEQGLTASSNIYPIEGIDNMQLDTSFDSGDLAETPTDDLNSGVDFIGGDLRPVKITKDLGQDDLNGGVGFVGGELRPVKLTKDIGQDDLDGAVGFVGGELQKARVEWEADTEGMDISTGFDSGLKS